MKNNNISTLIKGFIIGGTMLVPGVSGGTMAMILGIYEDLISAVSNFMKQKRQSLFFLGLFCLGAFAGMALLAKGILTLLENYNMPVMYFFIGAVVGGIPMILKSCGLKRLSLSTIIYPIIGAAVVMSVELIPKGLFEINSMYSPSGLLILFIAGFIAAIALILPGISVSFVLLVLGIYENLIKAFDQFDIEDREAQEHEDFLARQRESDMNAELAELEAMSDEEACDFYNVDSKAEASIYIREYYESIA